MAATITSPPSGLFDAFTRDKASIARVISLAVLGAGSSAQRHTARCQLFKRPDFSVSFTTPDNGALNNVMALSGATSRGVTFPAATLRTIKMVLRSSNDADTFYQEVEQDVWGSDGVTPVLGDTRLIRAFMIDAGVYKRMGIVKVNAVVAVEAADNSAGAALGAFSSGVSALTFPPGRAVHVIGAAVSQDAYEVATSPGQATLVAVNPAAGTASFVAGVTGAGTATDPPAADLCYATLEVWPVAQVALVMSSTAVQVHARTTLSDVLTHKLEVYVGEALSVALGA